MDIGSGIVAARGFVVVDSAGVDICNTTVCVRVPLSLWRARFLAFRFSPIDLSTLEVPQSIIMNLLVDDRLSFIINFCRFIVVLPQTVHPMSNTINLIVITRRLAVGRIRTNCIGHYVRNIIGLDNKVVI